MLTTKLNKIGMLGSLCLAIALGTATARAASPCPPNANSTGLTLGITFVHTNGVVVNPNELVSPCETLDIVVNIGYKAPVLLPSGNTAIYEAFSGGQLTLSKTLPLPTANLGTSNLNPAVIIGPLPGNPDGLLTCSTPAVGSTNFVFRYTLGAGDAGGVLHFVAAYTNGVAVSGGAVSGSTAQDQGVAQGLTIINVPSTNVCVNTPVTITPTVGGGAPPYHLFWTNVTANPDVQVAADQPFFNPNTSVPGTTQYQVTAWDKNNCSVSATFTVTVSPPSVVSVNNATNCSPGSVTLCATVDPNGPPAASFTWTGPIPATNVLGAGNCITVTNAGLYQVVVMNQSGCFSTNTGRAFINLPPVVTVNDATNCLNGSSSLCAIVAGNPPLPLRYVWVGPTGATLGTNQCLTVTAAGDYTVTVTDGNGCSGSDTGHLFVNPPPEVFVPPITICSGRTTNLLAIVSTQCPTNTTTRFAWTGPGGFTSTTNPVAVSVGGIYTVVITDCNGCKATNSANLSVDFMNCQITNNCNCTFLCPGTTTTLGVMLSGGVGPFTYAWNNVSPNYAGTNPVGTSSTLVVGTTIPAGYYSVTVTDSLGCTCTTPSVKISVDTVIARVNDPNCPGLTPQVCTNETATLSAASSDGVAPFQYLWQQQTTDGLITLGNQVSQDINQPGIYILTVTDAIGCSDSTTVTVLGCQPCVVRGSDYWSTRVFATLQSCATLQQVFNRVGVMNLGFLGNLVDLDHALGLYYGDPFGPGDGGTGDIVCTTRKHLAVELITAIANVTLLNTDSSSCGVRDERTGCFWPIQSLIQEAQAVIGGQLGVLDCNTQSAWAAEMARLQTLLTQFNTNPAGLAMPLPAPWHDCGPGGAANTAYVIAHQPDPTTAANCNCQHLQVPATE